MFVASFEETLILNKRSNSHEHMVNYSFLEDGIPYGPLEIRKFGSSQNNITEA